MYDVKPILVIIIFLVGYESKLEKRINTISFVIEMRKSDKISHIVKLFCILASSY